MGRVLAVTNRKGGTGKTMTSVSLGASLARQGKKILIIDADSQHSATVSLGFSELDKLAVNALAAADSIIIPIAPRFLDAKGMELLLESIAQTRRYINPSLAIGGILLTMVDKRANITKDIITMIKQAYGESISIFKEPIPHSVRAVETSATGKSIFEYDPKGRIAAAYNSLAREVLESA